MATESSRALVPPQQLSLHSEEDSGTATISLRPHCKPKYRLRKLTNKGAICIIVWNFLLTSVSYHLIAYVPRGFEIAQFAWFFTMPFAGWLADVRFGRHKVIRWSVWVMWIASMLGTVNSVVANLVEVNYYNKIDKVIGIATGFVMAVGFGGYQTNVIQFGLDQLQDASTTEITAFIAWYYWSFLSSHVVTEITCACMSKEYRLLGHLLACTSTAIVIISSFTCHSLLTKEPVMQNPLKSVYKVIRYAIKNKRPTFRSAFTYCEDELPSRIDFGKRKYGGPFTTEQVEDVKTFLRLIGITVVASILLGQIFVLHSPSATVHFSHILNAQPLTPFSKECYRRVFLSNIFECTAIAVYIPIQEFVLYPALHKYFPSIKIYQKFMLGVLLQMATVITLIAFDITARNKYIEQYKNISCLLFTNEPNRDLLSTNFNNIYLIIVAQLLQSISLTLLGISGIEFLASQTPYSMRGIMTGITYGIIFIFTLIAYGTYWPFTQHFSWGTGIISCEFWYLLSVLLVLIILGGLLLAVGRWYKNRKREDVLPNEHIFAERYYAQVN